MILIKHTKMISHCFYKVYMLEVVSSLSTKEPIQRDQEKDRNVLLKYLKVEVFTRIHSSTMRLLWSMQQWTS